jgi:CRISPR-associated protein Cas2
MFVVICYDIPSDRRRAKVGKILEGFGARVQKSVFECDLKLPHLQKLKQKLGRVLQDEDSLRYYYLCAQCLPKVEVVNGPPVTESQLYFAV